MKIKKIIAMAVTSAVALGIGFAAIPKTQQSYETASAAELGDEVFFDDFSAHDSYAGMGGVWANQWFDGVGDGTLDQACTEKEAQITNVGGSHGKVLQLNTATTEQSFFYLTVRDENTGLPMEMTDFAVTFDFYIKSPSDVNSTVAPWISILGRKTAQDAGGDYVPTDGRFNGTYSLMSSVRAGKRMGDTGSSSYFFPEMQTVAMSSMASPYGGIKNEDRTGASQDLTGVPLLNTWYTYKCVYSGNDVDMYINDVHLGGYTLPDVEQNAMYQGAGYISLACCVWDGYVDNFSVYEVTNQLKVVAEKNVDAAGTVKINGTTATEDGALFAPGSSVTLTAETNTGYTFDGWYRGTERVSTNSSYTFNVTSDTRGTYTAKWNINQYTINATSNMAEYIVEGADTYAHGSTVTLVAPAPNAGYKFNGWYENGLLVSSERLYTFTATGNRSVEAQYGANEVTVTAVAADATAGTAKVDGTNSKTVSHGTQVTLTATTNEGYDFLGWYDGDVKIEGAGATYTFNATATKTYTAKWEKKQYTISISSNSSSAGSVRGGGKKVHGSTVTLTATTKGERTFLGWFEGETKVCDTLVYEFTADSNRTLQARWQTSGATYAVSVSAGTAGGSVSIVDFEDLEVNLESGTLLTVKAEAVDDTYEFLGWYENGVKVDGAEATYTFSVLAEKNLVAKWRRITYVIDATAGTEGGSVAGADTYVKGTSVTLTATPTNDTYEFLGWYENGVKIEGAAATYTFNATQDRTLEAKWRQITFVIKATAGTEGGEVTGAETYVKGESVTLTASAIPGYRFLGWYEGGVKIEGAGATYTFTATANRTLVAQWELQPITKSANVTIGQSATVSLAANASIVAIKKGGQEIADKTIVSYDQSAGVLEFTRYYVASLGVGTHVFEIVTDTLTYEVTLTVEARNPLTKSVTYGQKAVVKLDKDVYIEVIKLNGVAIPAQGVSYDNEGANPTYKLTFDKEYLKFLGVGTHVFEIVTYGDIAETDADNITVTITVTEKPQTSSSGCGSVVGVSSAATLLGLAGVALIASKKRKNK